MKLLDILRGSETFCQLEWRYHKTMSLWAEYEAREKRRQSLAPLLSLCIEPTTEEALLWAAKRMAGRHRDDIGMIYGYLATRANRGVVPLEKVVTSYSYKDTK